MQKLLKSIIIIVLNLMIICIAIDDLDQLTYANDNVNSDNFKQQDIPVTVIADKILNEIIPNNDQYINESGNNINESGNINDVSWNITNNVPSSTTTTTFPPDDEDFENFYNQKLGLFLFTKYCGPGDRDWKNVPNHGNRRTPRSYRGIDACCKAHDGCENYIENSSQYDKFPGLSIKSQLFARLQCSCDGGFYKCLSELRSTYANSVAVGYGLVQAYCFDYEYPIVRCDKYSIALGMRRCEEYIVDASKPKQWQWFNLPPSYKKIYDFPRTRTS